MLEKGKDLFLLISDQHAPAVIPPLEEYCITYVRMSNMSMMDLGLHTVWSIVNEWSKHPKKSAVSADQFGALTLLQIAFERRTRITLFFASGSGLTLEGAQGQTYAMARILQMCNAIQFEEGDISLIRHVIFPQPLIPSLEKPNPAKARSYNIPKYELEAANAASRLLCLNSSSADKKLGTFISSTETVGLDDNLTCTDPISWPRVFKHGSRHGCPCTPVVTQYLASTNSTSRQCSPLPTRRRRVSRTGADLGRGGDIV